MEIVVTAIVGGTAASLDGAGHPSLLVVELHGLLQQPALGNVGLFHDPASQPAFRSCEFVSLDPVEQWLWRRWCQSESSEETGRMRPTQGR